VTESRCRKESEQKIASVCIFWGNTLGRCSVAGLSAGQRQSKRDCWTMANKVNSGPKSGRRADRSQSEHFCVCPSLEAVHCPSRMIRLFISRRSPLWDAPSGRVTIFKFLSAGDLTHFTSNFSSSQRQHVYQLVDPKFEILPVSSCQ
jgi:hypothetical protein